MNRFQKHDILLSGEEKSVLSVWTFWLYSNINTGVPSWTKQLACDVICIKKGLITVIILRNTYF